MPKRHQKICGKTRNFMGLFSKTGGNKATQGRIKEVTCVEDSLLVCLNRMKQSNQSQIYSSQRVNKALYLQVLELLRLFIYLKKNP